MALEKVLDPMTGFVEEAAFQYGIRRQGQYTIEDYEQLPEELRVELIDGVLYDMSGPLLIHQELAYALCQEIKKYIQQNKGGCRAMLAPIDIHLSKEDNKTMVQPDVFVVCDRSKFTKQRIEGAPDLIIEILSPSTKKKDCTIKLQKYIEAGVREYWLVDPDTKKIVVYVLEEDIIPTIYTFQDQIPVAIFDGQCIVDMAPIEQEIQFFYALNDDV